MRRDSSREGLPNELKKLGKLEKARSIRKIEWIHLAWPVDSMPKSACLRFLRVHCLKTFEDSFMALDNRYDISLV